MTVSEIKAFVDQQPFKPFRLHLSDGRSFDVKHPDFIWVLKTRVEIGLTDQPNSPVPDRAEHCSLLHIVSAEELQAA